MPEITLQGRCFKNTGARRNRNHRLEAIEGLADIEALLSILRLAAESDDATETIGFNFAAARLARITRELTMDVSVALQALGIVPEAGSEVANDR